MSANELNIITRTRGEVMADKDLTGENLFLAWGYPTAIILFIEFLAAANGAGRWCHWLWMAIPVIGTPLMIYFLRKDYNRTHRRTLNENVILRMWIFIGIASCAGGLAMGLADLFKLCYSSFQGLLLGMGCYLTGIILNFKPKTVCGIIAAAFSVVPLFFQGEFWPWQLLILSVIAVVSLIIPRHLFRIHVKQYNSFES